MADASPTPTPILIAGAGPTGLVLALSLARRGIPFRLIDHADGPGQRSRAMVVQARTLEFYRQFGFAEEVLEQGIRIAKAHLREGNAAGSGREVVAVRFSDLGEGLSPYPFPLCYPQDDHERFLLGKLRAAGCDVEWRTKLTGFEQDAACVRATIARQGGPSEEVRADYLCGCDGAHSVVRQALKLEFPGGTYPQLYYVADVTIAGGFDRDLYINLGEKTFALLLPVRSRGVQRLIGLVPSELSGREGVTFEDIRAHVEPLVGVTVTEVNWFTTYRVHHRVADHFRVGRAFIAGDAGHVHSPAGGQGMNTGIGDAINLGWKLAHVLQGRADPALLDTYEAERIRFARQLVSTTDRAFTQIVAGGLRGELARRVLFPLLFNLGTRLELGRHTFFRIVSQTQIHYEDSALSEGKAGHVKGGDRLPWAGQHGADNFAPLASLDWQAHVYGEADGKLAEACRRLALPLHALPWNEDARSAGLKSNAAYLVRPDGYVAVAASGPAAADEFAAFADKHRLRFG